MSLKVKKLNNDLLGGIEIFITGCVWGFIGFFVNELRAAGSNSILSAFFRVFFAMLFAFVISLFLYGIKAFKITKLELFWCILNGIITQGLFNYVYNLSVDNCGVAIASVLLYTSPVFNAIISFIAFREKMGKIRILILILNMLGCIIAATGLDFSFKTVSIFGIFMGLLSGLTYGAAPVLGKYVNRNPNLFIVIFYNELFASIFMLLFLHPLNTVEHITSKMLFYGIIYGVVITGIAYMFYYDGVKRMTEISIVPVIASVETVCAAIIGITIYKENLNVYNILGLFLVIFSILLMSIFTKFRKVKS